MASELYLDVLDGVIQQNPDKSAIVDLSGPNWQTLADTKHPSETQSVADGALQLTYADLDALANRVATRLMELGVQPQEPVAYQLPSGWEFIVLTLGIWRAGGVPCPLLPSLREREVRFILESSGSRLLVVPTTFRNYGYEALAQTVRQSLTDPLQVKVLDGTNRNPGTSNLAGLLADASAVDADALAERRPGADSLAQLLYTSGTTGEPKGVLHTFRSLSEALNSHRLALGLRSEDTVWVPSPLAHQTGFLYGMMVSHYNGSTGVYQAVWSVPTAKRAIAQHGARFVQAAMPFLADITQAETPPVGLRIFVATGAAVPRKLAQDAREALRCAVLGAWGSTECCLVTVGRPDDAPEKQWSADGRVIDGMGIRVVDEDGNTLPVGTEGNFQVKTPAMFQTYLHHHEWFLESLSEDGYFDTGDLAVIDEEGFLRLTGRKKDVINRGGEKVPAAEIEDILYRHPDVRDAAIVAMPDERLGERACVYLVMAPGKPELTLDAVRQYLEAEGVAKIYWPERVEIAAELPRTPSGKVQKFVLRKQITEKLAGERTLAESSAAQTAVSETAVGRRRDGQGGI